MSFLSEQRFPQTPIPAFSGKVRHASAKAGAGQLKDLSAILQQILEAPKYYVEEVSSNALASACSTNTRVNMQ